MAPLLFISYINYIKSCLNHTRIRLSDDDALLMIADRNFKNAIGKMQEDIDNLYIWLFENKLKLNISKTKFMILTRNHVNRDEYVLKIRKAAIQRVNVIKYLSIMIGDHLSFDDHLKYIVTKIARKIGIISRSTKLINKNFRVDV